MRKHGHVITSMERTDLSGLLAYCQRKALIHQRLAQRRERCDAGYYRPDSRERGRIEGAEKVSRDRRKARQWAAWSASLASLMEGEVRS